MARYFDNVDEFYLVMVHVEWDYKEAHEVTYYPGTNYEMTRQIAERQADQRTYYYGPYTKAGANWVKSYMESARHWKDDTVRYEYSVQKASVSFAEEDE